MISLKQLVLEITCCMREQEYLKDFEEMAKIDFMGFLSAQIELDIFMMVMLFISDEFGLNVRKES